MLERLLEELKSVRWYLVVPVGVIGGIAISFLIAFAKLLSFIPSTALFILPIALLSSSFCPKI